MFDIIKKSILAGIGAIAITEEKIQDIVDDFVQKGKLTEKEGESLINELQKTLQENKAKLTTTIDERVKCMMNELNLVSKDDYTNMEKSLRNEIATMKDRMTDLEQQIASFQTTQKN